MPFYGDDEYDYRRGRRPSPRRNISDVRRTSHHFLDPGDSGLYRTRSQGQGPTPIVNVYNDVYQDNYQRAESPYPPYPPSPGYGRRDRLGDDLIDRIEDLEIDRRRSRSRGRSDFTSDRQDEFYDWERRRRSEERRLREKIDLERVKSNQDEKDREKKIIDDYERKKWQDKQDEEDAEKRLRDKIKQEKIDKEEKEKEEYDRFLQKQKDEEDKKKKEKKEKEEEIDEAMRERLMNMGYTKARADMEIERERIRRQTTTTTTTTTWAAGNALVPFGPVNTAPTYAKVKREHIAVETLKYFGIPWEYDSKDKKYIIILREMTESETDALFEHTKQLRQKNLPLLLEPSKDPRPQYAFYRKRDRSTSRVRKAGILKYED